MQGEFQMLIGKKIETYHNFNDIPNNKGAVIKFAPAFPEEPHTEEDHKFIETFDSKLKELMERECRQLRE